MLKEHGGLGIINITKVANRLASKWMVRSLLSLKEDWAFLLHRHLHQAKMINHPKWKNLPLPIIFLIPWPIKPKGFLLIQYLWKVWNQIKGLTQIKQNKAAWSFSPQTPFLWLLPIATQILVEDTKRAPTGHKKGLRHGETY